LLERGAKPNVTGNQGETPLHLSALWNHTLTATVLIDFGAHLDSLDQEAASPLHFAAERGRKEMLELLLQRGATMNNHQWTETPLHWAAHKGFPVMAEILKKYGCSLDVPDIGGATPAHIAASRHNFSFCHFLVENHCSVLIKDKVLFLFFFFFLKT